MTKKIRITLIFTLLISVIINAQERTNSKNQDKELGKVSWYRDYNTAISLSQKHNKPVLILFQEVPGCATCRNYGHNVLSNPLMTEAIENEFIPLAIFNNKGGKDAQILKKYNEPSWNNPVVRIINSKGENIVNRIASDYSAKGLYNAMINALKSYKKPIPEYIKILGNELVYSKNPNLKEAHYKMYCFWTGEKQLGANEGVLETKAGFMNGEVVKVIYDSKKTNKTKLNAYAERNNMVHVNNTGNFKWSEKDEDYYLQHSKYKYIPLTNIQKTKINSALGFNKNPDVYLSPKQLKWLTHKNIKAKKISYKEDFKTAWIKMNDYL